MEESPNTLRTMLSAVTGLLAEAGVDSPRLSAELIMAHGLSWDRNEFLKRLILEPDTAMNAEQINLIDRLTERRKKGEPTAYILGEKEFYGRPFFVSPSTLIPRPETELLVDLVIRHACKQLPGGGCFLDLGTGSGCIALTLCLELPYWQGVALDASVEALLVARNNAERLGAAKVLFLEGNFHYPPVQRRQFDVLVSNPPYISEAEYKDISREVRMFEPKTALVPSLRTTLQEDMLSSSRTGAWHDGLSDIQNLVLQAETLLKPGGRLFMEIGATQGDESRSFFSSNIWFSVSIHKDLAGLERVIEAVLR